MSSLIAVIAITPSSLVNNVSYSASPDQIRACDGGFYRLIDGILTIFSMSSILIIYVHVSNGIPEPMVLPPVPLDDSRFSQEGQLGFLHSEFSAENLLVVLADERGTPGDAPGRTVVDRRPARIDEAASEFRVLDFCEEAAVAQMLIVDDLVQRAHPTPGESVFLPGAPGLFLWYVGKKMLQYLANVPQIGLNGGRVLIFLVQQILRQPVLIQHHRQALQPPGR